MVSLPSPFTYLTSSCPLNARHTQSAARVLCAAHHLIVEDDVTSTLVQRRLFVVYLNFHQKGLIEMITHLQVQLSEMVIK